MIEVVSSRWLW